MKKFGSVNEILDFAISQEEAAARFYTDLAERTERPGMTSIFREFASQELGHKAKLQSIKDGVIDIPEPKKVMDLKIAEYLVDVESRPDMGYQDALILAMKREKAAFKMYNDLAALTGDEGVRATMLALAQEEARHKLRIEIEYDERILTEN